MLKRNPLRVHALGLVAVVLVAAVALVLAGIVRLPGQRVAEDALAAARAPEQPVAFSHAHHAGELEIDCRACHGGAETQARAGFPPMTTCAGCHYPGALPAAGGLPLPPIVWQRVAALPDHTYFHHGIHVSKGVGCVECHGRVDRMERTRPARDFTMRWCLDCHRDPLPRLRPPEDVTVMTPAPFLTPGARAALADRVALRDPRALTHCNACHR